MSDEQIREEVARRLAAVDVKLPTSALGRSARVVAGLGRASRLSLGRAVRRRFGRRAPDLAPESAVAASFGRLKGAGMKMGQVLGYVDVGLPRDLRTALSALHTHAQPLGFDRIRAVVEADLGVPGRALAGAMEPRALSAASIGQVHRSALPDGTQVVVKILYPQVARTIARDFGPAALSSRFASLLYPSARAFVREVRERVQEECDYALEARRQARFAELFADHPTIVVPAVHRAYCSSRVLTTTFVDGLHLDTYLATGPSAEAKDRVAAALFDFYLGALFQHGLYHCDPHPGNYLFTPDGRLALIDFGCAREFEPGFVGRLALLTQAVMADDRDAIYGALRAFGIAGEDRPYHHESTRWLLRALYGSLLRDEVGSFQLGDEVRLRSVLLRGWRSRKLAVPGELLFLLRTVVGLSSALARLDARANWHRRLQAWLAGDLGDRSRRASTAVHLVPAEPTAGEASLATDPRTAEGDAIAREREASRSASGSIESQVPDASAGSEAPSSSREARSSGLVPSSSDLAPETGPYELVLLDAGDSPIALVRELRELTGLELRDIKYLLDAAPQPIRPSLSRADAERWQARLESAGARVEVRPASASSLPTN